MSSSFFLKSPIARSVSSVRVGLCQITIGADKASNLDAAAKAVADAAQQGAKLVLLPEMLNCPYSNASFPVYAEPLPEVGSDDSFQSEQSVSFSALRDIAKKHDIYLVAGSIPERSESKDQLFNTCLCFGPDGKLIAKHRKMHLFDINIPGKMVFRESETLTGGDRVTTFDTPYGRVGVGICYDIRFPELSQTMTRLGCTILCYPGAFNLTTGPAHWMLLQRARAVDNQCFVLTCSPARVEEGDGYKAYGHSAAISPWADVLVEAEHGSQVVRASFAISLNSYFTSPARLRSGFKPCRRGAGLNSCQHPKET